MRQPNNDINIFVACHKDFYVPENKYLIPVQVGAKNAAAKLDMVADDTGENISELNPYFCELTAQYWAWKNVDCEYYGFFHYRRYFSFADYVGDKKAAYGDLEFENITDDVLRRMKLDEAHMAETIKKYDIILPRSARLKYEKSTWNTVYKHYKESPQHDIKDLDRTVEIIHDLYPHFDKYVKRALSGKESYFLNMYIMKKKYFFEYCEWLFPILLKFHGETDYKNASAYVTRTPGFIAERLVKVFMLYLEDKYENLKVLELQNTFFQDSETPYLIPASPEKVGICMASDELYAKHLGVALQSIVDNSAANSFYDIVVFDNKISLFSKELLQRTVEGKSNFKLRFVKTSDFLKNKNLTEKNHINKSSYLRFAIPDLLRNYSKVLYLDCDLVVNRDVAELFDVDLGDNYAAAVRDVGMAAWNNRLGEKGDEQRRYNREVLGLDNIFDYFNAGVMVFNLDKMKGLITTEKLFDIATQRSYCWQDQDVLNKVCNGKVLLLPNKWNYSPRSNVDVTLIDEFGAPKYIFDEYAAANKDPYIVHFAGRVQPMFVRNVACSDIFWKYARNSVFYEEILADMFASHGEAARRPTLLNRFKSFVKRVAKKLFPYGSRRGTMLRKLYHIIRK